MSQPLEYRLIQYGISDSRSFEREINDLLRAGWMLHGTTHVCQIDRQYVYIQAMTKETPQ